MSEPRSSTGASAARAASHSSQAKGLASSSRGSVDPRNGASRVGRPTGIVKLLLSGVLVIHLLAVVAEPLCMFSRGREPASPEAAMLRRSLAPYVDFAYLNHGYFFFAPNPGPSHLMDIRLLDEKGEAKKLRLPNHQAQWPRLLYHRHFMLSEFLNQLYAPPAAPVEVNEMAVREAWQRDRGIFERVRTSMERHLAERYGAKQVEIRLVEHRLPSAGEVFDAKMSINDEQTYIIMSELSGADPDASTVPSPGSPLMPGSPLIPGAPQLPGNLPIGSPKTSPSVAAPWSVQVPTPLEREAVPPVTAEPILPGTPATGAPPAAGVPKS